MIVSVAEARYVDGYRIWLRFNTQEAGITDLSDLIACCESATPLRDHANFARFHLDAWPTLAWDCGFDVAPELLYERVTGKLPDWQADGSRGCDKNN